MAKTAKRVAHHPTYYHEIQAVLEARIAELKAQLETAARDEPAGQQPQLGATRGAKGGTATLPAAQVVVRDLDLRLAHLEEVRDVLSGYPELVPVLDAVIGRRIDAAARRQRMLSIAVSIASIIAGWLLSLIGTPATLIALWPH